MAKLSSPLKGEVFITQTYHTGSNNTAIDLSATSDTPVYAVADGVITYKSSSAGSYCIQELSNSDLKVYYVHTYKWVKSGSVVKRGDVICYIAPTSLNGGFPTHLHIGLQAGKYIMDYFDRSIIFRTRFSDIRTDWFSGENLKWSLFKDLNYMNNSSSIKVGNIVKVGGDTNMRFGNGKKFEVAYTVKSGSVGKVIDGPREADGYTWFDIEFEECSKISKYYHGWMANVNNDRFKLTDEVVTCVDGSKKQDSAIEPVGDYDELKETIAFLEKENKYYEGKLSELANENENLLDLIDELKAENKRLNEEILSFIGPEEESTDKLLAIVYERIKGV